MKGVLLGLIASLATTASAQGGCMTRENMVKYMTENLYQSAHWAGVSNGGGFIELWQHTSAGWTITIYDPAIDMMCLMAQGHSGTFSIPVKGKRL